MDTPNDLMMREEKRRKVSEKKKRKKKKRKVSENHGWSKLCPDLLRIIIERLSFIDFHRAKTVCSDWYSVWKTCMKRPLYPWRIFYEDGSLKLFDPREDKIYTTRLSDKSHYMASFGYWLLMVDSRLRFYIFNLLTCQRINLPSMETPIHTRTNLSSRNSSIHDGHTVRFKRSNERGYRGWGHCIELGDLNEPFRKDYVSRDSFTRKRSAAVLWIDERTGDYVVAWIFKQYYLFTYKKGDESWLNWNSNWNTGGGNLGYLDLAYDKSKLYLYTSDHHIKIIDFSGDFPKEEIEENPYRDLPFDLYPDIPFDCVSGADVRIFKRRIAIQKSSGEVLIVLSMLKYRECMGGLFYIFKMNVESGKWERVDSIGDDEMLIVGHGVTIRAPVQDVGDGIKNGSICFVQDDAFWNYGWIASNCAVFDLATSKITLLPKRLGDKTTQWFVPGFA